MISFKIFISVEGSKNDEKTKRKKQKRDLKQGDLD
jgi:hypothetical protein